MIYLNFFFNFRLSIGGPDPDVEAAGYVNFLGIMDNFRFWFRPPPPTPTR